MSYQSTKPDNPRLKKIINKFGKPLIGVKIRTGLTEIEAHEVEKAFIAAIGRECDGGPLVNESIGGESPASGSRRKEPWVFTEEWRRKLSIAAKKRVRYPREQSTCEAIRAGVTKHWASTDSSYRTKRTEPARRKSIIARTKGGSRCVSS